MQAGDELPAVGYVHQPQHRQEPCQRPAQKAEGQVPRTTRRPLEPIRISANFQGGGRVTPAIAGLMLAGFPASGIPEGLSPEGKGRAIALEQEKPLILICAECNISQP